MIRLRLLGPVELAGGDEAPLRQLLAQPKRLAVLAYLAVRPAGTYVRRDALLGVFWPDLPQDAARRSLRQALHVLRSGLGAEAILTRGDEEVALDPARVAADVPQFLAAVAERRPVEALDLYRGDLLAGFFLSGASVAFERWLEDERARLRDLAARAAEGLAEAAERGGDPAGAAGWARRALALVPDDEVALRRLLTLLERAGDRAGALRSYDSFARRLARELDEQPSEETRALVARLRGKARPSPMDLERPTPVPRLARRAPARRRALLAVSALAVLFLVGLALGPLRARPRDPVLAVGNVTTGDSGAPALASQALPELLSTGLARVNGLSVISHPRLEEIAGQLIASGHPGDATAAARAAGADEMIEGVLYRMGRDSLRLDLRRADTRRGVLRDAVTVAGRDVFALADSAVARFAARLGRVSPSSGLASVTSPSLVAHGFYDEGLRAYYRDADYRAAIRLFQAALAQDSTFAMAAYYLGRSYESLGSGSQGWFARAAALASHAPPREALYIRVWWPAAQNDPGWPALAESLAARYPDEPAALYAVGVGRSMAADYRGSVRPLRDAIRMDSLSLTAPAAARCIACDAYGELVQSYINMDSLAAADSLSRAWVGRQPRASAAWWARALVLNRLGRGADAVQAQRVAGQLAGARVADPISQVFDAVYNGDYSSAERLLAGGDDPDWRLRRSRVWWRVITLRYEGRPRAAADAARALLAPEPTDSEHRREWLPLGISLFEAGDYARAADAFDSASNAGRAFEREHPWSMARRRAWTLTLRATVAAAQGDTVAVRTLADTVAAYGVQSALGRDRLLRAYIHGLALERAGRWRDAVDSLRLSAYSPTEGFTRVNLELARTYLRLAHPRDAIYWLQAALRGGIEGSNLYVTRPLLREELAHAFDAAGMVDSARAEYALVARAWANAEPLYRVRRDTALAYLARPRLTTAGGGSR